MRFAFLPHLALAACSVGGDPAAPRGDRPPSPAPAETPGACDLTIGFGSYAMGIDRGAFQSVEARLAADPAVTGVEPRGWGREGEVDLCVATRTARDAERLHRDILGSLPADPRGPISLATRSGLSDHVPPRR